MSNILEIESRGIKYNVRLVRQGEKYGLKNCLTNEKTEPLVEFYDTRYPHTEYGQCVNRYNLTTLLERKNNVGLDLDGGVPDWKIDSKEMSQIKSWLISQNNPHSENAQQIKKNKM